MLNRLIVTNYALIEDVDIKFDKGLTAITGETGAGKSILLGALSLLFGKRSEKHMIRHGATTATITGEFLLNKTLQQLFDLEENITITRILDESGRNQFLINDKQTTLSLIKDLTKNLGDMHDQDDTALLKDKDFYLKMIDNLDEDKISKLISSYLIEKSTYEGLVKRKNDILKDHEEAEKQLEFYQYQLKELKGFNLKENEIIELEETIEKLKHFDKYKDSLIEIIKAYESNMMESLYMVSHSLKQLSNIDEKHKESEAKITDLYYELEELKSIINDEYETLDFDADEFDYMQERIFNLKKLETKYGKTINELIIYIDEISYKINLFENKDGTILELDKKINESLTKLNKLADNITNYRKKLAKDLEKLIVIELQDLNLKDTKMEIEFNKVSFSDNGNDEVEWMISLNEGEPLKPLHLVASGGERSRVMLALKSLYAKHYNLSLLILDEIDTGVSGVTAGMVGNKLLELSKEVQILIITHLPQVAAISNHHYNIKKEVVNNRMITSITKLSSDERIIKIAEMLSSDKLSSFALEQAKLLLNL